MYFLKGKWNLFISLKGNRSEDASCPVNVKNVQIFPYAAFGCSINIYAKRTASVRVFAA